MTKNNPELFKNFYSSLLKFCQDFNDAMTAKGYNLAVVNFDAHSDINDLPQQDCVGIMNYALTVDDHFASIRCMIGVTTLDDTNLFRLNDLSGELLDLLLPTRRIEVVDHNTGQRIGLMSVQNGTRALPASGQVRPARFIAVSLLSDQTWNLS